MNKRESFISDRWRFESISRTHGSRWIVEMLQVAHRPRESRIEMQVEERWGLHGRGQRIAKRPSRDGALKDSVSHQVLSVRS